MGEGRDARGCRGGCGPEDSLCRPPTTCRAAAFTPPRLPPAGAAWAVGAARGVGRRDSGTGAGGGAAGTARPPHPHPTGLPSRAYRVERRRRVLREMASGGHLPNARWRCLSEEFPWLVAPSRPTGRVGVGWGGCWGGALTRGTGRWAGTGEPRWRPLVPDLALRALSCGDYRRKTRPTPSFPHEVGPPVLLRDRRPEQLTSFVLEGDTFFPPDKPGIST